MFSDLTAAGESADGSDDGGGGVDAAGEGDSVADGGKGRACHLQVQLLRFSH